MTIREVAISAVAGFVVVVALIGVLELSMRYKLVAPVLAFGVLVAWASFIAYQVLFDK